jgi:hypothetical protein
MEARLSEQAEVCRCTVEVAASPRGRDSARRNRQAPFMFSGFVSRASLQETRAIR